MLERDRGGILNVASTAAFQLLATMAVYGATKAFVLSFTEALWAETRTTGVRVMALCPGATETGFFDVTGNKEFMTRGRQSAPPPCQPHVETASVRRDCHAQQAAVPVGGGTHGSVDGEESGCVQG